MTLDSFSERKPRLGHYAHEKLQRQKKKKETKQDCILSPKLASENSEEIQMTLKSMVSVQQVQAQLPSLRCHEALSRHYDTYGYDPFIR